jgi:hypothetical protein
MPVLDQETFEKVTQALARAKWTGTNPAEALNRAGLLWTPDREHQIRLATMRFVLEEMSSWTPAEFLRRRNKGLQNTTPMDMYICIREWLQEHLAYAITEGPET